jgi:cytoskeletal protein CcmA (bactofilin family)
MFKSKNEMAKGKNEGDLGSRNHIAQGTSIKGDVITEGDIRIDGKLEGTVVSKGKVVVGTTGHIEGEIKCDKANFSGRVKGKATVSEMVSIQATGSFSGELVYGKLGVEPGAELEGTFVIAGKVKDMKRNDEKEQKRAEKTA